LRALPYRASRDIPDSLARPSTDYQGNDHVLPSARSLEGKRVPDVTFKTRANHQWKDVTTDDLFKGRTVVVFSLPGALYADLLERSPAALQRARRHVQSQWSRSDRVPVGKRRLRHE